MKESIQSIERRLLREMLRIRLTEEEIARRYAEQKMRCPVHLSIGQEAPAAAFSLVQTAADYAVSTHRAHAHFLAKGGNITALIAELHGKITGCSSGAGGSMHLADHRVGFMGSSAIVGNSIPVGVGLALALTMRKEAAVSWVFLGDAATEQGVFYESLNYAALAQLPIIFMCENNGYSVYSDQSARRPENFGMTDLVQALGCQATKVDGNDVMACLAEVKNAKERVKAGFGPIFLEFSVFRQREHCGPNFDDDLEYRPKEYVEAGFRNDPIETLVASSKSESLRADQEKYTLEIEHSLAQAFELAESAEWLTQATAAGFEYA